ncbi:uracil-DNA glycosylase [Pseudolabrys taiwanensis]|uniref:Type-4 uracil-DNA glycosylase n=1 Tax=Pseudolabrys taiwanensis TaxID=331696 RepID=A0A345ZWK5_9HYPH|nr:UdgX family uracil-DNA binding protein [Pseudolabrys taiwanensis]AXK81302.1 uracil-DNA glycosylase [Pseudolabrys taiwanensis]
MDEQAPDIRSLKALRTAEAACTRCPLYKNATQVVSGEGPARARILMVGEQPGDQEDKQGHPFVGPAGRVLQAALDDAGISRGEIFITNAVKHFKFEPRGKRRLHKRPNAHEIDQCHWWLDAERKLVKPSILVALGATAVRSVSGHPLPINKIRGRLIDLADGGRMLATIHPSYILRIEDEADKRAQYRQFVADLKVCVKTPAAA